MRVGQLGAKVHLEVVVPVHLLVPELDCLRPGGLVDHDVLLQHRVDHRVDVLVQVLKEERQAVLHRQLELLQEVSVIERLHLALEILPLAPLDPVHSLHLRIDAQREPARSRGQDAVLHRQLVGRQTVRRPLPSLHLARQEILEPERSRHRQLPARDVVHPQGVRQLAPVLERECARVRQERGGEQAVAEKFDAFHREHLEIGGPTRSLRRETGDELLGGDETTFHQLRLVLQTFLLRGGRLELRLELRELFVERDDRLFRLGEFLLGGSKRLLRLRHRRAFGIHRARDGVVVEHGKDPLEQTAARLGDAGDKLGVEVFVRRVLLDLLHLFIGDGVLIVLLQRLEEVGRAEHHLGVGPTDILLLLENLHALAHLLHGSGGLGERLDLGDILLSEVFQRLRRRLERGNRLGEVILRLLFLDGDTRRVHLELLLFRRRRLLLRLDIRGAGSDHLEELVHLLRGSLHDHLRLGQGRLHH